MTSATTTAAALPEEEFRARSVRPTAILDEQLAQRGRDAAGMRRILLAYGPLDPWAGPDALPRLAERYGAIGFDEIVCYAPSPAERAVFDKVTSNLSALR